MSPLYAVKMQGVILCINIMEFYIVGLPMTLLLTFNFSMGITGLFIGPALGTIVGIVIGM